LGPFGINVNAYAPGTIATDMAQEALSARVDEKLMQIPLGRFGQVEDVAQLILFLSSDESSYITGTTVLIDGGALSVHSPWRAKKAS
jgi:3-oxoacyl-[acyl-carrier protein] reductase